MQILLAEEMRALDRAAEEEIGIPGLVLMENAGRAVADAAEKLLGACCHKKILIFAGKGNNGGDGSGAGRWLHNRGAEVRRRRQRRRTLAPQSGRGGDPGPGLCGRRTVRQRGG